MFNVLNDPVVGRVKTGSKLLRVKFDGLAVFRVYHIPVSPVKSQLAINRCSTSVLDSGAAPWTGRTNLFAVEPVLAAQKILTGAKVGSVSLVPTMGIALPQASEAVSCLRSINPFNWRHKTRQTHCEHLGPADEHQSVADTIPLPAYPKEIGGEAIFVFALF